MKKSLIISIVWLCGTHLAAGQCGSARDTDLNGPFVSSTSSDQCSGGGFVGNLAQNQLSDSQQDALSHTVVRERASVVHLLFFSEQHTSKLIHPSIFINQLNQMHDPRGACLQVSVLGSVSELRNGGPFLNARRTTGTNRDRNRKMMVRAALERGW